MLHMHDKLKLQHLQHWLSLLNDAGSESELFVSTSASEHVSDLRMKVVLRFAPSTIWHPTSGCGPSGRHSVSAKQFPLFDLLNSLLLIFFMYTHGPVHRVLLLGTFGHSLGWPSMLVSLCCCPVCRHLWPSPMQCLQLQLLVVKLRLCRYPSCCGLRLASLRLLGLLQIDW